MARHKSCEIGFDRGLKNPNSLARQKGVALCYRLAQRFDNRVGCLRDEIYSRESETASLTKMRSLLCRGGFSARRWCSRRSELQSSRGRALRYSLYLFARDEAVGLLSAG